MNNSILKILFLITILFGVTHLNVCYGQSVTIDPTPASCPGQGSAAVSTVDITNPFFQLKDNNGVNIGSGNSSGIFLALDAGNYQVQVTGEGGVNITESFTVENTYQPIPTPTINLNGFCDDTFTMGGTLSISMPSTPTGKTYSYKVVKTTNPNFPDTEGTYQAISTVTTITEYDTYQVRIKDECGQFITVQRDIAPALQEIHSIYFGVLNNQPCDANAVEMASIQFFGESGNNLNFDSYLALGGVKLEMWERSSGSPCPETAPSTTPIFSEIIEQVSGPTGYILPMVPNKRYIVRATTPCGQTKVFCVSDDGASTPAMQVTSLNAGCDSMGETMTISGFENFFLNFPVTVTVTDSNNVQVYTSVQPTSWYLDRWSTPALPLDDYTVTYTDQCGVEISQNVANPNPGGTPVAPTISNVQYTKWKCFEDNSGSLNQHGTTQVTLTIDGYIPNRANAVVTIISGPSNVGKAATIYNNSQFAWTNMLPGDYTISVDSGCGGTPITLSFTANPVNSQILWQSLTSVGTSFCTGGGSIMSDLTYTGNFYNIVQLLDEYDNFIAENVTGNFTNIAPGTYQTRLKIGSCTGDEYFIYNPNPIVITDGVNGPQIIKKIGVVCEDATGTPTSTGSAYFEIAGASPIVVRYKKQSDTTWTLYSSDVAANFEIEGLEANQIYEVEITSCGSTITTTVAIQSPGVLTATNTVQPCVDQPYTFSVPDYAGATYEWKNPAGVIVSTERNYNIANYEAYMDGTYTATITWGDCVVRYITLNVNSQRCGEPIDSVCTQEPAPGTPDGFTQVGITVQQKQVNWPENIPNGFITLESKTKGFVITRVQREDEITDAKEGMLIYDIDAACVKLYNGTIWNCIERSCNE